MNNSAHPLLAGLNAQQQAAVGASDGPVLVLAGPGSGKTRVLTHRIAWMLQEQHAAPWQVLAVTFTNKAAREMRERLARMLAGDTALQMSIGTFHAICARLLRREADAAGFSRNYLIFDTDDQLAVMKQVVKDLNLDDKRYRPASLLNAISHAKNELTSPAAYPVATYYDQVVARAYARYQETLRGNEGLDFDDLLVETVKLFQEHADLCEKYSQRYRYVLVDEFQDTNMAQYLLLRLLTGEHRSLYAVADEDQSIYSWRGADYRNITRLRGDYPGLVEILLEENYRSTQIILDAAQALIAPNPDRTIKRLFTRKPQGLPLTLHEAYDEAEEATFVAREIETLRRAGHAYSDCAVMYRTNAQSRALEEALVYATIPYRLVGGTRFYSRREIKDLLAYLRLILNPDDDISFQRVVNVPRRGIGKTTLASLMTLGQTHGSCYKAMLHLLQSDAGSRGAKALRPFAEMLAEWHALRVQGADVRDLTNAVLAAIGYEGYLRDGTDEGEARWENVLALRAVAAEAPGLALEEFLTDVALVADVDELGAEVQAVTLLTLHSAKGLEFPIVFITGLEEGLLPHSRSLDTPHELAEERRLFYVGMTRAEDRLYLTHAFRRSWYGESSPAAPSRFLDDIPPAMLGVVRKRPVLTQPATNWNVPAWRQKRPEPPAVAQRFAPGQAVRHRRFGDGVVRESVIEHGEELVTVLFFDTGAGERTFLATHAPLEAVSQH